MGKVYTTSEDLTSIANAIRAKAGTEASLTYPTQFVSAIQNISTGGGGGGSSDGDVIFIDYDGTVVASKTKAEITAMSSDSDLPANPTHTGLTAQGWNWTVTQLKAQLTATPDQKVYVGQMYVTTSGATEIDVVMHEGRLSPVLTIAVKGEVSVDWGDNTTPDTVTGTSETTRLAVNHTYASAGNYTICISKVSGTYSFYGSSSYTLLRKNTTGSENRVYANCIQSIRIGTGVEIIRDYAFYYCYSLASITIPSSVTSIQSYVFAYCYSLASITIPSSVTSIGSNAFYYCFYIKNITIPSSVASIGNNAFQCCYSLASITIPSGVTSIADSAFYYCNSLENITIPSNVTSIGSNAFAYCCILSSITIPSGVTSIGNNAFQNCYSLASITLPSSVTSIGNYAFYGCYSLVSVAIPSNVTSIGDYAFSNCYGIKEYHFQPTSVPTAGTTIFKSIVSDAVIYVPFSSDHSILEAYKAADNWSTYATYMQEEPQS